ILERVRIALWHTELVRHTQMLLEMLPRRSIVAKPRERKPKIVQCGTLVAPMPNRAKDLERLLAQRPRGRRIAHSPGNKRQSEQRHPLALAVSRAARQITSQQRMLESCRVFARRTQR